MSSPAPSIPATPEQPTQPSSPAAPADAATEPARIFTQGEVDHIIRERLDRQQRAIEAKASQQRAETEAAQLAEQGKYKELAEAAARERDDLKTQLAHREHADLQRAVAAEHHLAPDLAARLQGTTRDELVADAKALAKLVTPPAPPAPAGNRPNPRPQSGPDGGTATEVYLRASGRYQAI